MATVWIPAPLRDLTRGAESTPARGGTVGAIIDDLEQRFPGFRARLCAAAATGVWRLKPGWAVVVGADVARAGLEETVAEESEIHFVQAIGGGLFDNASTPHF